MLVRTLVLSSGLLLSLGSGAAAQRAVAASAAKPTPADGFTIHVTAPHMLSGHAMGPVHHYCKVIAPDPIIQCLLTDTADPNAPLTGIEYIISKKITRNTVSLGTWNANFHDHKEEIASGRVLVLDMPADKAKEVADLVATTDGIIFHLWPMGDRIPTGTVEIGQSVSHKPMSREEYTRSGRP